MLLPWPFGGTSENGSLGDSDISACSGDSFPPWACLTQPLCEGLWLVVLCSIWVMSHGGLFFPGERRKEGSRQKGGGCSNGHITTRSPCLSDRLRIKKRDKTAAGHSSQWNAVYWRREEALNTDLQYSGRAKEGKGKLQMFYTLALHQYAGYANKEPSVSCLGRMKPAGNQHSEDIWTRSASKATAPQKNGGQGPTGGKGQHGGVDRGEALVWVNCIWVQ